jgi:site-specific DNA-methyltransferase (adenine-specific)
MAALPDNSVDMVLTDPPYFKVKADEWDRQWEKPKQFLAWLDRCVEQWARILKPNGSLYCFASPQMSARVECLIAERLNVLNHIVWAKPSGRWGKACKEELRGYFPSSERIIFAEHYGADNAAKGEAGYGAKCDELRGFIFEPLRAYLIGERDRSGHTTKTICAALKCTTPSHYFSQSQWALPTADHYQAMRELLNNGGGDYLRRDYDYLRREYEDLRRDYDYLRRDYEDLRREYEDLRRPFSVTADVPYTDVWTFDTVRPYAGKHPCEKPQSMLEHVVSASSRVGGVVLDCFMGSGTTGVACKRLGRNFIGIELDPGYFNTAKQRIEVES